MRRSLVLFGVAAALVLWLTPGLSYAQDPNDNIDPNITNMPVYQSPHNLNNGSGVTLPNNEVCRPCHTPHNVQDGQDDLWNHEVNEGATYTLYAASKSKFAANYVGLDHSSKLCLSCHDGAIAIDNYGGKTDGTHFIDGSAAVGLSGDLSDDHPIGLRYPGLSADGKTWTPTGGYNDPLAAAFGGNGLGSSKGVQLVKFTDGSMGVGCRSCHHSHNSTLGNFLRTSMKSSNLCFKCHIK